MSEAYHFWSPTCAPCRVIKPAIEDLKEEFPDIKWTSVNSHNDTHNFSTKYAVNVVPTIVFVKNGAEVGRHSGTNMGIYYTLARRTAN